jgi:conjugative relaxase-like TrwC/TraI family protein
MMGAGSVRYHDKVVAQRADDFPGQTLAYYGSRGETPMVWDGAGAARLGLTGAVRTDDYYSVFADGGAQDPVLGERLVATKRPGMELVVSAHKTVAVLGVVGRADDMHRILDAETQATMAFLDTWTQRQGGRRGRLQVRTPTSGLTYGTTRHATSRAGDPNPHDHVLVANAVEMLDDRGGWKALDTAGIRDMVHAATAVGRLHAAWEATRLGYGIRADPGPSGKLDHFAIAGIPEAACRLFSKRSEAIDDEVGPDASYRLRATTARANRPDKNDDELAPEQLMDHWHHELAGIGLTPAGIVESIEQAAPSVAPPSRLSDRELAGLVEWVLSPAGPLAGDKQFGRGEVIRHLAPRLHGRHPDELTRAVGAVIAHPEALPLVGQPGARNRAWVLASTRAAEEAIADCAERLATTTYAVSVDHDTAEAAVREKEWTIGGRLTPGQRDLVTTASTSGRQLELVLGVAGAGKTTALDALRTSFETDGHRVIGTATSGQAAKTLGDAAHINSHTTASLLWRLQHGREQLGASTVLIVDEAGMVDDPAMLALLTAAELHGSKVVVVGDHHQLGAVGPGGGLEALTTRHPDAVHHLTDNIRQQDPAERAALEQLRSGDVLQAVAFYAGHGRIDRHEDRWDALLATTAAWHDDLEDGHDTVMLAWRRADVAQLNHFARMRRRSAGHLGDTSVDATGGRRYSTGDHVVALAPDPDRRFVTSQRGLVTAIDKTTGTITVDFDPGSAPVTLSGEEIDDRHLDHAYATTVHRAQGATVDRAHVYANGGGRELTYVALSRARHTTTLHCVADTLDQAAEDLERDWSVDRRQRWTLDTDLPATPGQPFRPALLPGTETGLRLGRLRAERAAIQAAMPAEPDYLALHRQRREVTEHLEELRTGTGRYTNTPIGAAAKHLAAAEADLGQAERHAGRRELSRWQRRKANGLVDQRRVEVDETRDAWLSIGGPIEDELNTRLEALESAQSQLRVERLQREAWLLENPATVDRLEALDRETQRLELETGLTTPDSARLRMSQPSRRGPGLAI